ncbi:MAG: endolytic transglycosylase MltG [Chitinophagales bacterium]|nr:endolytic transglycosylase MltG [Chitinophagales bacterium]HRN93391.1 endolytic transglycosylase MltG [Chitinophagales bacterium]
MGIIVLNIMAKNKKSFFLLRTLIFLFFITVVIGVYIGYTIFSKPNVAVEKRTHIYIPTDSTYTFLLNQLQEKQVLKEVWSFEIVAQLKELPYKIKSGHYVIAPGMNNRQVVNMFRAGLQEPVKLVIYNIRTKEEFSSLIGRTIEADSASAIEVLNSDTFCKQFKLDTANILAHFIVDNYELWWNTPLSGLWEKLNQAHDAFWNEERLQKAAALKMNENEIVTLASIVEKEAIFDKEMPTIAGVYLNRLKIKMPLQADPTLVFALRDFNARRVLNYHKDYSSPYNTYQNAGLPPGPICMPRKKSIDAVLNAEQHQYLYFCANPDMSGYSIFSKTYEEQMKVAAKYRKKLDAMNISK